MNRLLHIIMLLSVYLQTYYINNSKYQTVIGIQNSPTRTVIYLTGIQTKSRSQNPKTKNPNGQSPATKVPQPKCQRTKSQRPKHHSPKSQRPKSRSQSPNDQSTNDQSTNDQSPKDQSPGATIPQPKSQCKKNLNFDFEYQFVFHIKNILHNILSKFCLQLYSDNTLSQQFYIMLSLSVVCFHSGSKFGQFLDA